MQNIRLVLDVTQRDVNVIFDEATGSRMTTNSPLVFVDLISNNMKASIVRGKVIDVDNASGIEISKEDAERHDKVLKLMGIKRAIKEIAVEVPETITVDVEQPEPMEETVEEAIEETKVEAKEEPKSKSKPKNR